MSEQNQSFLRFSLEESIWFPKGFEVSELYSLSIEPDVNIIEKDQYVVIEGYLDISGEYRGFEDQQENNLLELEQNHRQLVQDVLFREADNINVFNHRFPVDISIPSNRIDDRNAVEVEISTFDYSMPESNCIKLMSELLISGIYDGAVREESSLQADKQNTSIESMIPNRYAAYNENEEVAVQESARESSFNEIPSFESFTFSEESRTPASQSEDKQFESHITASQNEEQAYESFTVEAYALPRQESAEGVEEEAEQSISLESFSAPPPFSKPFQEPPFSIPMPVFKAPEMEYTGLSESVRNNLESQGGRNQSEYWSEDDHSTERVPNFNIESKGIESEETSIVDQGRSEEESLEIAYNRSEEKQSEEESLKVAYNRSEEKYSEEESIQITYNRSEEVQEEAEEEVEEEAPGRSGSVTVSLTDFFGKKDTQTHTRLKVCIVQAGDSLSEIAGRYEVSRLDLLSLNELDSENDLQEGQVLYIPQKVVRK